MTAKEAASHVVPDARAALPTFFLASLDMVGYYGKTWNRLYGDCGTGGRTAKKFIPGQPQSVSDVDFLGLEKIYANPFVSAGSPP